MAYVEPQSEIVLYRNVPLDKDYKHTIYFDDIEAQNTYFNNLPLKTIKTNLSWVRENQGMVKIDTNGVPPNYFIETPPNYMRFKNTRAVSGATYEKWYYAFVDSIDYDNERTIIVNFIIDVMQTWFFEFIPEACFVERETSATDIRGENLVPENLETGEYRTVLTEQIDNINNFVYIVGVTDLIFDPAIAQADPSQPPLTFIYNTLSGIWFYKLEVDTPAKLQDAYTKLSNAVNNGRANDILFIFPYPKDLLPDWEHYDPTVKSNPPVKTFIPNMNFNTLGDYRPRNKKLLTYPYTYIEVNNMNGDSKIYPFEYFSTTPIFQYTGDFSTNNPLIMTYPFNYKGIAHNYTESIVQDGFPQVPIVSSSYQEWLSRNKTAIAYGIGSSILSSSLQTFLNPTPAKSIYGTVDNINNVFDTLISIEQHKKTSNVIHGSFTNSAMNFNLGICNFTFMHKCVRAEFAKIIDDFFSMYGYATHRVKVPNRKVRAYWTYCKTQNMDGHGRLPSSAKEQICRIYNKGITFWTGKDGIVGSYQDIDGEWYTNEPITEE